MVDWGIFISSSGAGASIGAFNGPGEHEPGAELTTYDCPISGAFLADMGNLSKVAERLRGEHGWPRTVGVVVDGDLDGPRSRLEQAGAVLKGWCGHHKLADSLADITASLEGVGIGTPAEADGCVEMWWNSAMRKHRVLTVCLGEDRLSMAVVVWRGGRPVAGPIGQSSEFIHRVPDGPVVSPNPVPCPECGRRNCYDRLLSAAGAEQRFGGSLAPEDVPRLGVDLGGFLYVALADCHGCIDAIVCSGDVARRYPTLVEPASETFGGLKPVTVTRGDVPPARAALALVSSTLATRVM